MKAGISMYFLDTYAMIEYFRGTQRYVQLIENNKFFTSNFQLIELYYSSLRNMGEEMADDYFEAFSLVKVEIPERTLKNAMKTRLLFQNDKKYISYVDAIGYQYAVDNKMKFVTGDKEFKNADKNYVLYLGD